MASVFANLSANCKTLPSSPDTWLSIVPVLKYMLCRIWRSAVARKKAEQAQFTAWSKLCGTGDEASTVACTISSLMARASFASSVKPATGESETASERVRQTLPLPLHPAGSLLGEGSRSTPDCRTNSNCGQSCRRQMRLQRSDLGATPFLQGARIRRSELTSKVLTSAGDGRVPAKTCGLAKNSEAPPFLAFKSSRLKHASPRCGRSEAAETRP